MDLRHLKAEKGKDKVEQNRRKTTQARTILLTMRTTRHRVFEGEAWAWRGPSLAGMRRWITGSLCLHYGSEVYIKMCCGVGHSFAKNPLKAGKRRLE
jgi:hypothetical protein